MSNRDYSDDDSLNSYSDYDSLNSDCLDDYYSDSDDYYLFSKNDGNVVTQSKGKTFAELSGDVDGVRSPEIEKIFTTNKSKIIQTDESLALTKKKRNDLREELIKFEKHRIHIFQVRVYISTLKAQGVSPKFLTFEKMTEGKMNLIKSLLCSKIVNKSEIITKILSKNQEDLKIITILINHIQRRSNQMGKYPMVNPPLDCHSEIVQANKSKILQTNKSILFTNNKITELEAELKKLKEKRNYIFLVIHCIFKLREAQISPNHFTFEKFTKKIMNLIDMLWRSEIEERFDIMSKIMSKDQEDLEIIINLLNHIKNS